MLRFVVVENFNCNDHYHGNDDDVHRLQSVCDFMLTIASVWVIRTVTETTVQRWTALSRRWGAMKLAIFKESF